MALGTVLLAAFAVRAENVDLSTVPARNTVQLTIYNSEDLTLVRETRKVTFKPGANPLQFSWANTLIDPTSVELRFLTNGEKLTVLDTTFPHAKPQMLYWNVQSELDGEATIEITYFTSGISWSADYIGIADADESQLNLEGFVRVNNNSGEEYEDAQVRLVVGRINLVQKIAELARIPVADVDQLEAGEKDRLGKRGIAQGDERADERDDKRHGRHGHGRPCRAGSPQGGRQGRAGRVFHLYHRRHGDDPQRLVQAAAEPGSGQGAGEDPVSLPPRRIWRQARADVPLDQRQGLETRHHAAARRRVPRLSPEWGTWYSGRDGLSFLAAQAIKYVPIGDKIELNLGPDPEVIFDLVKLRTWRDALWMQVNGANVFRRVDQPGVQIEINSSVAGWNDHTLFAQRVRNYTKKPIDLEIRRTFPGHVIFRSELAAKAHDFQTVEYTAAVKPGEKAELLYEVVQKQGHNATQNNVTIEKAAVTK